MVDVKPVIDWLVAGVPGATTPPQVVEQLCSALVTAGLPIERTEVFVRTLHPHIVGRGFVWTPGRPVEVREHTYAYLNSPEFLDSPAAEVFRTGKAVRCRLDPPATRNDRPRGPCPDGPAVGGEAVGGRKPRGPSSKRSTVRRTVDRALGELARQGFVDFFAGPLCFLSGQVHAASFATRRAPGFSDEHIAALEAVLPPLSRIAEIFALARTAANLLNTYVGHNAGERILAGQIQRGHTDAMNAVLWFSDLRGFTSLSASLVPNQIIRMLNDLFDCQVPSIERHGGEVLKFMGDGLLAIFPTETAESSAASPSAACERALRAAAEAFGALAALNRRRASEKQPALHFGLALHVGEVAYGNIGGSGRLDFTCIGPSVNLASRLQGLTGRLGCPLVVSADFAKLASGSFRSLGSFELKGVAGLTEVFAPLATTAGGNKRIAELVPPD